MEPNGQITVNIVLYGGTVLYGRTPSFQTDRTCTILYGVLRYGTVITVKKAEVRRVSTSLVINGISLGLASKIHAQQPFFTWTDMSSKRCLLRRGGCEAAFSVFTTCMFGRQTKRPLQNYIKRAALLNRTYFHLWSSTLPAGHFSWDERSIMPVQYNRTPFYCGIVGSFLVI